MNKKSILFILPSSHFNDTEFSVIKKALEDFGIKIFIASDSNTLCISNAGRKVKADINFLNIHEKNFSGIVFIGGDGARAYWNNKHLHKIADKFNSAGKIIAAICSAPVILAKAGILNGIPAACYFEDKMELIKSGIEFVDTPVVVRNNIITASEPSSSLNFAEAIISLIIRHE